MSGGLRDFEEETPVEEKAPHVEFVSQVESLLSHPCTELCFDPTPGFGDLKGFFPKEAISHPAKINIHFLRYLITRYTNLGDTILDPMAGSGSTAVVGTLLDRNAITIELEDKFFEWENGVDCDGWTCYAIGCYKRRSMEEEIPKLKKALEGINEPVNFSRLVWKDAPNEGSPLLDLGASPKDAIEIYEKFKNLSDLEERYNRLPKKPHHFTGSREFVDGASTVFKGKWSAIKGDARNLPELVGQVGISISSPPYAQTLRKSGRSTGDLDRLRAAGYSETWIQQHHNQPNQNVALGPQGYSDNPANIANLPVGSIADVVTSPPYVDSLGKSRKGYTKIPTLEKTRQYGQDTSDENIGNLRMGVAEQARKARLDKKEASMEPRKNGVRTTAREGYFGDYGYAADSANIGNLPQGGISDVVTSPPYSEGLGHKAGSNASEDHPERLAAQRNMTESMASEGNLSALKHGEIDRVVSSPPYEGSEAFQDTDFVQKISGDHDERILEGKTKGHLKQPFRTLKYKTGAHISQGHAPSSEAEGRYMERAEAGRITHPDSLGKLHKETYLEAMRVVYFGMFQVLKPGGRAVIIVKPFSREKKVVDLPWQTWLLMQSCGFEFEDTVKLRLKNLSFWRVLQYKKNPGLEQIRHEYAVVCHKPLVVESK
jgi:hypothetical protein